MGEVEKPTLQQTILLISSLISLSHSIRVFSTKWQSVRYKLDELFSSLTAVENCEFSEDFSLSITLESILLTLRSCHELANRCLTVSFSGKLLMKSDLDILSAKFDTHIKSLSDIYSMGLLTQNCALVVSRPSVSASRDDIKFYINDLLSRLKIGSTDMKKQALFAFNEVIKEDERYVKVSIEIDSLISLLVNFLDFHDSEIQEEAAKALCLIAGFQCYKSVLISAGVISPLIRVLACGSELSKEFAARCLMKVSENSDNAWSISAHGGVTALLKICGNDFDNRNDLVGLACGVLRNLVGVEEIKRFMVEEGAISEFIKLARCKDEVIQINSLDLLQTMAYGDESIKEMIIQGGGIRTFVRILDPKSSFSTKTREVAFRGIVNICCLENSLNLLVNYGFLDHILYFLRSGDILVQELSLKAAFWLCGTSTEAKKVMGDAGFMQVLVTFLDSKSFEIREIAAETLSNMVIVPKNRKRFVQNDQNVGMVLQMLDPMKANSGNKKLLLSILMSLTNSNSARKKIVNSGYLKNIEKLAEVEGSDAQKIVRKLSCNRFRSILNGLWHS
ncbi:hypothetical protein ACJIZ3_013151 [Penstemon smallii]|uniref:DUF7032 domain-containing protein n=1 Tax=Penstemon smallii TaxID=265156 RepID=A0ABD3UP15_9LAMI